MVAHILLHAPTSPKRYLWVPVCMILAMSFWTLPGITQEPKAQFVGSESCKGCHAKAYEGWKKTRMANVVRDPKLHPEAVVGDFTHADPLRTFGIDEVALVYGSRYKQRYFVKRGDDYYPMPAQWDIAKKTMASVPRGRRYRLVGSILWPHQLRSANRSHLRWMPFGQLQNPNEADYRVECRLREVPWAGQPACCTSDADEHRES